MAQLKDLLVTGAARILGKLYASEFVGKLTGNADSATKATKDSANQQINTTYIKGLSVSGRTITYTKGDNTTGTITTQDTDTWRGIQNNLTSTATDQSLSAAQGKILNDNVNAKLPLSGGAMTGNISYKGSKATYPMIKFIDNTLDTNGNGIVIGGGGLTIVGGGESSDTVKANLNGASEQLILANDGPIDIYTNCQDGLSKATHNTIDNNGLYSGTAAKANKLSTARNVSGGTDITMSFNYDGSGNSGASIGYYSCSANNGNTNNYPFHRFAKLDTITEPYVDKATTFLITQDYIGGGFGIVRVVLRAERSGIVSSGEIKWLIRSGIAADSVQMGLYNVFGSTYADLFFKSSGTYAGTVFRAIANGNRGSVSRTWVLTNSNEVSNTTSSDKKTSTEVYTNIASAATTLHKKAYSTTVIGVDAGAASWSGSANRVADSNNSKSISLAYSKPEMKYNEYTWLAGWNGYELRAVDKTQFAAAAHTHNYAGSGSAGGSANSAVKLATARSINGTNFDGSGNITTANWGTARTITVGNTGKSVNGSGNVSWSLGEIGIHVSKTVPTASDGKNGDIWIVYE